VSKDVVYQSKGALIQFIGTSELPGLLVDGAIEVGSGDKTVSGQTLVKFNTSRAWEFQATGSAGASQHLELKNVSGVSKNFRVVTNGYLTFKSQDYTNRASVHCETGEAQFSQVVAGYNDPTDYEVRLTGSDPSYVGPQIQFGRSSDPDDYMVIGAYSAVNNIDSKDRQLFILSNPGASNPSVKIYNNYNTQGNTKYILGLWAYHTGGSAGSSTARHILFRDHWLDTGTSTYTTTTLGLIEGDGSGGIEYNSSFTGKHASVIASGSYKIGMIVESTGEIWIRNTKTISTALPKVQSTSAEKSKTVYGVVSSLSSSYEGYVTVGGLQANEMHIAVNSIGEGLILVTDRNGEVQNGDYIVSSEIPGYGMKQDDDILRSSTVAKCTEEIDWTTVTGSVTHNEQSYKAYLSACTYHCG
jgi:hypothetical protein